MKKIISITIILLMSLSVFSQKRHVIKPITKKNPVAILYGKKKNYYHLNKSLDFPVEGLKKIVIYTRELLTTSSKGYSITYSFNTGETATYASNKSIIDKKSAFTSKVIHYRTSKLFKKVIEVPKNAKSIHLFTNSLVDVYIKPNKKGKSIKPLKPYKRVKILTGKTANYYKLNSKIPKIIHVKEAGKLYVYTRKRLSKKDTKNYSYHYKIGKVTATKVKVTNAVNAKQATYKSLSNKRKPSIYHKQSIDIKESTKIVFSSIDKVDARFVFVKKWNEVLLKKSDRIDLITKKGNKTRKYFRVSPKNNFSFKVTTKQKTKGKIFLRGEFTYDMISNNDYKIILKDFGKIVTTYKLSCNRSKEMNYKDNKDKIPGTLDKIFFDIPKGKHQYSISIGNKHKTALVRVLLKN